MKAVYLLVAVALFQLTSQQACPQDPKLGNPINYVHLFKEQTDVHFDFYNTKTTFSLLYQQNINSNNGNTNVLSTGTQQRIVIRITDSSLPVRSWLYMIDIKYDTNGLMNQIDRQAKLRSNGTAASDLALVRNFFGDNTITLGAASNCCLAKLEYINFYYMFAQYYKNGQGAIQPACTN